MINKKRPMIYQKDSRYQREQKETHDVRKETHNVQKETCDTQKETYDVPMLTCESILLAVVNTKLRSACCSR